jgi:hypothetical protein
MSPIKNWILAAGNSSAKENKTEAFIRLRIE